MPWLCFNDSFLSIVAHEGRPDHLLVRARRKGDIERVFPGAKVAQTRTRDYLFRAELPREEVAAKVAERLLATTETNFKNSVKDRKLHDAYAGFWSIHGGLQPGGPYGMHRKGGRDLRTWGAMKEHEALGDLWPETLREPGTGRAMGRASREKLTLDPWDDPLGDPLAGYDPDPDRKGG